MTHRHKHRHFIAAPVCGALVMGALLSQPSVYSHQVLAGDILAPSDAIVALSDATSAMTFDAADLQDGVLTHGTILAYSNSVGTASVPQGTVTFLGGAVHITVGKELVVAAVSAPAVFRDENNQRVLVPQGYYWRGSESLVPLGDDLGAALDARSLRRNPQHFLAEQLAHAQTIADAATQQGALPAESVDTSLSFLRLPAAKDRLAIVQESLSAQELRTAVGGGDSAAVQRLLQSDDAIPLETVAQIALEQSSDSPTLLPLLHHLSRSDDVWLAASVHSTFRSALWALDGYQSDESSLLFLFAYPQSDVLYEAIDAALVQRWHDAMVTQMQKSDQPGLFLRRLVALLDGLADQFERENYPLRAQQYVALHDEITAAYPREFEQKGRQVQESTETVIEESSHDSPLETTDNTSLLSDELLLHRAQDLLRDLGASYTVETSIEVISGTQKVAVRGVVFRDHLYNFVIDADGAQLLQVQFPNDKRPRPFPLPVASFASQLERDR